MSGGGSLGLRTSSYGSLQNQLQNNNIGVVLPTQTTTSAGAVLVRNKSKMLLSVGREREKEKFLPKICKFAGRRRVGMLLILIVSVVVLMSVLVSICKVVNITHDYNKSDLEISAGYGLFSDEDVPDGADPHHTQYVQSNIANVSTPSKLPESPPIVGVQDKIISRYSLGGDQENSSTLPNNMSGLKERNVQPPAPIIPKSVHPCAKFILPPPPADKKRIGPRPCPVCYLPIGQAISSMPRTPSSSPVLTNLTYVHEENPVRTEPLGGSDFGGYPSLERRNNSFDIKEQMNVHCGFVKGSKPGHGTGFDIDDTDLFEMEHCDGIVVASAIFGNYDIIQQPKNISEAAKENVCFYMFVDEETEAYMKNSSSLNEKKKVGIWRVVVVRNLPYKDARRNGKVPKLLLHRIFPNARYSIWIDGKLELIVDPYQILERFLWRNNTSFAISRHYRRFDVFKEAEANKAAGKYSNASIDNQVEFYKREGLTPYSEAKLPITSGMHDQFRTSSLGPQLSYLTCTWIFKLISKSEYLYLYPFPFSVLVDNLLVLHIKLDYVLLTDFSTDVPEGCVIIKEHIPITNLFTCLWFNEVDRFTSRDQISFSTVRDKIMSKVNWSINMFMDCERRNFVVQGYHRDLLEHRAHSLAVLRPPPPPSLNKPVEKSPPLTNEPVGKSTQEATDKITKPLPSNPGKRRRKSSSKHHRKTGGGIKDSNFI
ncbi:hypothetical protein GIB67_026647 [Kingdonia uniflora]|uniref:TOD1/MUCI70 glycosyltransferase-like domain-containing protein n=1 Tax=Kingdonia uniflora TaxID=39325 RepID=A0A7J7NIZ3_9MAGN|nr:hypothetical protein GIB67_026647 [Kingdonia uniflora]